MTAPAAAAVPGTARGRRALLVGGARSGKSTLAEAMLARAGEVVYVATGHPPAPDDPDWAERVRAHRAARPPSWTTVETLDIAGLLHADGPPLLVDCLTLWLSRTLDAVGAWEERAGWSERADHAVDDLVAAWSTCTRTVVGVVNDVGSGVVPATRSGRVFRDLQGRLTTAVSAQSDDAYLVVGGRALALPPAGVPAAWEAVDAATGAGTRTAGPEVGHGRGTAGAQTVGAGG